MDLAEFNWHKEVRGYASRHISREIAGGRGLLKMHRVILARILGRPLAADELCDHVNGNRLDNRRDNLRLATATQNTQNRAMRASSTTGVKGVTFDKQTGKWRAIIGIAGRPKGLGRFATPEEAGAAYEQAAQQHFGEWRRRP